MSEKDLFNICLKLLSKKFNFLVRLPLIKTRIDLKGYFEVAFCENRANRDTINLFRNLVVAFLAKLSVTWQLWMGWGGGGSESERREVHGARNFSPAVGYNSAMAN